MPLENVDTEIRFVSTLRYRTPGVFEPISPSVRPSVGRSLRLRVCVDFSVFNQRAR